MQKSKIKKSIMVVAGYYLLFGAGSPVAEAQSGTDWCATTSVPDILLACGQGCDRPLERNLWFATPSSVPIKIRIKFIVFADNNGENRAASEAQVNAQFNQLKVDFAPYNIDFLQVQPSVLNNTTFRNFCSGLDRASCLGAGDCRPLSDEHAMKEYAWAELGGDLSGQLNIYVVNMDQMDPDETDGIGYFPWCSEPRGVRGGIVMNGTCLGGAQCTSACGTPGNFACGNLLHEIGHNLGLWHTNRGSYPENACGGCYEPPPAVPCVPPYCDPCPSDYETRDNSGDFCCDTPPTSGDNLCDSPEGDLDGCAPYNTYGPTDPTNYMGLGRDGCWSHFTRQQTARLQCWTCDDSYGLPGWIEAPSGACCLGSTCTILLEPCCLNQGGTFGGAGTICENCTGTPLADVCEFPAAACCTGSACSMRTQACCTNAGGAFKGGNTDCQDCTFNGVPDACEAPARACCHPESYDDCIVTTEACCELDGGNFRPSCLQCGSCECPLDAPEPLEPEP